MDKVEKEVGNRESSFIYFFHSAAALLRIEKQYGTLLVLLPALWALFIASRGRPDPVLLLIIVSGAFLMRSAGCAINDIADRNFDPHVERTKERPLASGKLTLSQAVVIFCFTLLLAALLTFYLNPLAVILCTFCLFFVILYPFTKRFISLPQLFLGIAFGWGSVIVWAAVKETVELTAVLIFLSTATWAVAYDTVYAMMDIEDDLKVGVKSAAILFGKYVKEVVALFFAVTILLFLFVGLASGLAFPYYTSVIIAALFFVWQIRVTGKGMSREIAFSAFKSNVTAGFVILTGIILNYVV
ncbi:MAG: 4-hydroxybenzoate octaprenyltransferase [Deltaproteobacteria bacterium]|nr:4-hydroxybenzoate octaprenyltransferase [Deltaproteobacteria bacterium]